jgi:RimJ/RimL family protein N-acetyltransferase
MEHFQGTMSREASDAFVDRIEAHWKHAGWGLWAVELPHVARFIGYVGLWPADYVTGNPMVEVGWRLAHPHWGHGYASEGAREALQVGFEELALEEIVSFTVPQNERSRRVMERIGLIRDPSADFDHPRVDPIAYPQLVRHVLYRLSRSAWKMQQGKATMLDPQR